MVNYWILESYLSELLLLLADVIPISGTKQPSLMLLNFNFIDILPGHND
jgi:hypothetical protein